MRNQNIQGIILKKRNFGEYDQFITIYSPTLGKFDAMVKGVRKINSSFGGHLEILNICNFNIYKSAYRYTITQCQTVNSFKDLKKDLQLSMLAFLISEIFYHMTPSDEQGEDLFILITQTLNSLSCNIKNPLILESFKIKLLQATGNLPDISECSDCHHKWKSNDTIGLDIYGHIKCMNCSNRQETKELIGFNIMKLINFISQRPYQEIENITLKQHEHNNLKKLTDIFLHSYIDIELKSEKIARQMLI